MTLLIMFKPNITSGHLNYYNDVYFALHLMNEKGFLDWN